MKNNSEPTQYRLRGEVMQPSDVNTPEFKGKFLVCLRQSIVYSEDKGRYRTVLAPTGNYPDLDREDYVLFGRN